MRRGDMAASVVPSAAAAASGGGGGSAPPISQDISFATYAHRGSGGAGSVYYYVCEAAGGGTLSLALPVVDFLYAFPFVVGTVRTADQMSIEIQASGGAGSQFRFGFYRDDGAVYPSSLVVDSGVLDGTSTGFHAIAIDFQFQPGLYWGAFLCAIGAPTIREVASTAFIPTPGIGDGGTIGTVVRGIRIAQAFAAFPAFYPAGAAQVGSGEVPTAHRLRYSA